MKNAQFKTVEEVKNFKIPFVLSEAALTDWLNSLLILDDVAESVNNIFCLIGTLNKTQIPLQQRVIYLEKICRCLKQIVKRVDKKQDDMAFPLPEGESRVLELIVWSYLSLARGLCFVAKTIDDKAVKAYSWYQALFSLAQAYLQMIAVYSLPSKGFWRLCYYIYSVAEQESVLNAQLSEPGLEEQTIDALFKQMIVFSLANPYQFRAREMKTVFKFLEGYVAEVNINNNSDNFVFNLNHDCEPRAVAWLDNYQFNASTRSIATVNLAKTIYQDVKKGQTGLGGIKGLNHALLTRLIKSLGGSQTRKFRRVDESCLSKGIVGLDYLTSYLRARKGEVKANSKKEKLPEEWALLSKGYEHVHQMRTDINKGYEHVYQMRTGLKDALKKDEKIKNIFQLSSEMSDDMDVWGTVSSDRNKLIENIKSSELALINSSIKGYALRWNNQTHRVKVGDVFGIISTDSKRLEITIIRRLQQLEGDAVQLGVEVIGFESAPVYVCRSADKKNGRWNLFLPRMEALKEVDSLVYKTGDYKIGEFISVEHNKSVKPCRLTKLINATQAITQAELFFLDDNVSFD